MADGKTYPEQFRGWLLKWTNYIKGYQRRWFVLSNGLLSYYRTQEEMAHTCRGTINLAGAFVDTIDATNFVITNGPSQVYHLRALNEVERQRWVTALELAKAKAVKNLESDDSENESDMEEDGGGGEHPLLTMEEKLHELNTAHDLVVKNSHQLMRQISEVEEGGLLKANGSKLKEKLALFRLTTSAMVKAAGEYMEQARNTDRRWSRALQHEHSLRLQLQENLEALANQMHGLESEARASVQDGVHRASPSTSLVLGRAAPTEEDTPPTAERGSDGVTLHGVLNLRQLDRTAELDDITEESEEEDKFFDAPEATEAVEEKLFVQGHKRNVSSVSVNEAQELTSTPDDDQLPVSRDRTMSLPGGPAPSFFVGWKPTLEKRRLAIPPKPHHRVNLWNIMKNCIGRDLSKIPMPVNFNEPLSMLQRMMEEMLYAKPLLDKAAACKTTLEELTYVATYTTSNYAHAVLRVGKPFNPMLGETYECDRRAELGWRSFLEQVSHHPPMVAMHVEHKEYTLWQEYTLASKFRGKYLLVIPIGCCHLMFHRSKSHYTLSKANSTVHNIIVGRLWVDQSGETKTVNHTTGEECRQKYSAYSYFSREQQRKVYGTVNDAQGVPRYLIKGYWDQRIECGKILGGEGKNLVTEPLRVMWEVNPPQLGHELIYGFSEFTCSLNELEDGIAPTDSRLRPDQRIMENGDFDGANADKLRLEEKQRAKRRKREAAAAKAAEAAVNGNHEEAARLEKEASYTPRWFQKEYDPLTNTMMHVYKGGYWEQKLRGDWEDLPDIF